MALRLSFTSETTLPLELEGVLPERVCDMSLAEIERLLVWHGNRQEPLATFARVSGDPSDQALHLEGELSHVHRIGAGLRSGVIRVLGSVGHHAGSQMRGGSLVVEGDAGDWLGGEMRGGTITVHGRAGNLAGAAFRGSPKGMRGGRIVVRGNVGDEIGHSMRRGMIAVGGSCGDHVAVNMLAGSVFVFGSCGKRPGAGMRRGTIALLGEPVTLLPTFSRVGRVRPQFMRLALQSLRRHQLPIDGTLFESDYLLHRGDLLTIGRGEILMRA